MLYPLARYWWTIAVCGVMAGSGRASHRLLDRSLRRRLRNRDDRSGISSSPFRQIRSGRVKSGSLAEAIKGQIGCDA